MSYRSRTRDRAIMVVAFGVGCVAFFFVHFGPSVVLFLVAALFATAYGHGVEPALMAIACVLFAAAGVLSLPFFRRRRRGDGEGGC